MTSAAYSMNRVRVRVRVRVGVRVRVAPLEVKAHNLLAHPVRQGL